MTSELTYQKFLFKINKGNTGGGISCDLGRFVVIINETRNRWVEALLRDKDSILIDSLQELVKSKTLLNPTVKSEYVEFDLDDDFYEAILAKSLSEKKSCKWVVYSREIKNQNKNIVEWDENQKPSFEWEWTFHTIQGNKLRVYKTDFDILSTDFEYYSKIPEFDIEGYEKLDGSQSTNKPFSLSDQYVDQIINRAATEFERNFQNQLGVTMGKDREISEE